jgi:segregation and condensation protein A
MQKEGESSPEQVQQVNKVGQEQIHDLLFGEKLSWQSIIYDLINTEQLDPWDIDLGTLSGKYLEKVRKLEEANFFVSSKVLMAASLLLRIKSEILLNNHLPGLDDILYGREEDKKGEVQERLELDGEIPDLVPRTPIPRMRKVTLQELMGALGKAIKTEERRIRKIVVDKQRVMETDVSLPKRRINVHDKMKEVYKLVQSIFSEKGEKMMFSDLSGMTRQEKIETFVPLLHLDNQQKVVLEQDNHLGDISVWMKGHHNDVNREEMERLKAEVEAEMEGVVVSRAMEEVNEGLEESEDGKVFN